MTVSKVGWGKADGDGGVGHGEGVGTRCAADGAWGGDEAVGLGSRGGCAVLAQVELHVVAAGGVNHLAILEAGVVSVAASIIGGKVVDAVGSSFGGAVGSNSDRSTIVIFGAADGAGLLALGAAKCPGIVAVVEGEVVTVVAAGESPVAVVFHVDKLRLEQAVGELGLFAVGHPTHKAAPILCVGTLQRAIKHAVLEVGGAVAQVAEEAAVRAVAVG